MARSGDCSDPARTGKVRRARNVSVLAGSEVEGSDPVMGRSNHSERSAVDRASPLGMLINPDTGWAAGVSSPKVSSRRWWAGARSVGSARSSRRCRRVVLDGVHVDVGRRCRPRAQTPPVAGGKAGRIDPPQLAKGEYETPPTPQAAQALPRRRSVRSLRGPRSLWTVPTRGSAQASRRCRSRASPRPTQAGRSR